MKVKKKKRPLFSASTYLADMTSALNCDLLSSSQKSEYHMYFANYCFQKSSSKFLSNSSRLALKNAAYAKFLKVNAEMRKYNLIHGKENDLDIRFMRNTISHILGSQVPWDDVFLYCKNSQGASIGVTFENTSDERKFKAPVSCTEHVMPLWSDYLEYDDDFRRAFECLNTRVPDQELLVPTVGSRASTVPKDDRGDRMIAVEPVVNMFFQHGLAAVMIDRLQRIGLSVTSDPDKHVHLAFEGSVTNGYATIDFSSMSDRVSLGLCKLVLPDEWYRALCTVRSDYMMIENHRLPLHMISTMGNATTFPLQTLVLWAAIFTVQSRAKGHVFPDVRELYSRKCDIHVFGDDCIMKTRFARSFLDLAQRCGFVPNVDKSFFGDEYFRESCGGDFYHGRDVRPLFIRSLPSVVVKRLIEAHLYTLFNEAVKKYIKYFGPLNYVYDKELFKKIFSYFHLIGITPKVVPWDFPDDSGLKIWEDLGRFSHAYNTRFLKPEATRNGGVSFSVLSYKYPSGCKFDERLRYAISLKRLMSGDLDYVNYNSFEGLFASVKRKAKWDIPIRKGGTYVQLKIKSTFHSLPQRRPLLKV